MTPIPSQASRLSGSPSRWPHVASLAVLLAAFWSTVTPVAHAQEVPVSWAEAWGVSVSGDGLTKVAPLGWNASAVSTKALVAGDGYLAFTVGVTADLVCGLTTQAASQGYERIDFGIRLASDGTAGVVESGLVRTSGSPYLPGDGFRVAVEDGVVHFYQNGVLLYSSTKPPSYPLSASASLYTPAAEISTAALSGSLLENVFWTNGVNVTVAGSDLSKSGGAANTWNAGAVSTRGVASPDGYVEWVASETTMSPRNGRCGVASVGVAGGWGSHRA